MLLLTFLSRKHVMLQYFIHLLQIKDQDAFSNGAVTYCNTAFQLNDKQLALSIIKVLSIIGAYLHHRLITHVTGFCKITHNGVSEIIRIFMFNGLLLRAEYTFKIF